MFLGWLLSIFIIIILCAYIVKREPVCERAHLDEIDRSKELIPDEETALKIADAIISVDKEAEWDEDFTYEVSCFCQALFLKKALEFPFFSKGNSCFQRVRLCLPAHEGYIPATCQLRVKCTAPSASLDSQPSVM